jgi:hypothetical protein
LIATTQADPKSIMCYQIPGFLTKNGQPIVGGSNIVASDYEFVSKIYPMSKKRLSRKPSASQRSRRRGRGRR